MNPQRLRCAAVTTVVLAAAALPLAAQSAFDPQLAGFRVRVRGEVNPYRVLGVYVLPAANLSIEVLDPGGGVFSVEAAQGAVKPAGKARWSWTAPAVPGLYPVDVFGDGGNMRLNVFVLIPLAQVRGGYLNGYRIDEYPATPLRNLAVYRPPRGFVEVTPANESTPISPHFTLRQFLCKQAGGPPRYVVLRERLLLKLEYLLRQVNEHGFRADTFAVLSGFRTPFYNHAIGNVKYSRHQWGGAADIFIDESPRDGMMDDLDGDGRIDVHDAAVLYELVERQTERKEYKIFTGGLGQYGKTASHGPFIHVDARGFRARWGR